MKILKISIYNLNSLKGEFLLDFEKPPLKNAGLFLISGKTGAGKTTILDSITLALYGEAPRFEDAKGKSVSEMMTHGSNESRAEVTFSTDSGIFVAKWQMRRTRTGNLERTAKRELLQLFPDGSFKILATKINDVNQQVEILLGGLNFNRFKRSIMLAQGDFAQFLKGTEDRSDILERITDTALYSEISKHAHLRHRDEEKKLQELTQQASFTKLMSTEELELLQSEKTALSEQAEIQKENAAQYRLCLDWFESLNKVVQEKEVAMVSEENLLKEYAKLSDSFALLNRHQKAWPLQSELKLMDGLAKDLQQLNEDIKGLDAKKTLLTQQLQASEARLQEQQLTEKSLEQQIEAQEPIWEEVKRLDTQLQSLQQAYTLTVDELTSLRGKETLIRSEIEGIATNIQQKTSEKGKIEAWLSEHAEDAKLLDAQLLMALQSLHKDWQHSREMSSEKQTELDAIAKRLEEKEAMLKNELTQKNKLEKELQKMEAEAASYIEKYDESQKENALEDVLELLDEDLEEIALMNAALVKLSDIVTDRSKILNVLDELSENKISTEVALENSDYYSLQLSEQESDLKRELNYQDALCQRLTLNMSLEQHRAHLQEGQPCPLCLSIEQPFRSAGVPIDFNAQFAREEVKLKKLREVELRLEKESNKIVSEISFYLNRLKHLNEQEIAYLKDWDEVQVKTIRLFHEYPMLEQEMLDFDTESLDAEMLDCKEKNSLLEDIRNKLNNLQKKQEQAAQKLNNLSEKIEQIEKELVELRLEKVQRESVIQQLSQSNEDQLPKLNELLHGLHEPVNSLSVLPKLITDIEKRKLNFEKGQGKLLEKTQELTGLEAQLHTQTSRLEDLLLQHSDKATKEANEKAALEAQHAARVELFGAKDPQQERQLLKEQQVSLRATLEALQQHKNQSAADLQATDNLLEDKLKTALQKKEAARSAQEALAQQLEVAGFDDIDSLRRAILPELEAERLQQHKDKLEKQLEKNKELLQSLDNAYKELNSRRPTELSIEEVLQLKKEAEMERDSLLSAIGQKQQILAEYEQKAAEQKELVARIEVQSKELQRWRTLYDLIGHAEGKKFRQFAQNITLNKLIQLANKHLQMFVSGRYLLEKRAEDSLEIDIIDTFQANNKRPLNTLSGGETFLASLSLALGLSDLAGGRAHIESLFIDEGFGTLDSETLSVALRALQTLQEQGKTIGIISHVVQLQHSIEVQIQVNKKSAGHSEISYIGA